MKETKESGDKPPVVKPPKEQFERRGSQVSGVGRQDHEIGRIGMNRPTSSGK